MIYIILSVFCSVTVAVLLKLSRKYKISIIQAVLVNYLTALTLCFLCFKPDTTTINTGAPWLLYISLAILLPVIFLFLAASVKHLGIVKTDIAQRLSLLIPVFAAYFIFGDNFNTLKFIGLGIGFPAIIFTFIRKNNHQSKSGSWMYPVFVFIGFGAIDVLFKQVALHKELPYTTSLFIIFSLAFFISLIIVLTMVISEKIKLRLPDMGSGLLLGLFNFGNILFYLKAHKALASNPSTVFAAVNLGVIVLGTLVGITVFKERLSKLNYAGIVLAVCAVILITLSQLHAV